MAMHMKAATAVLASLILTSCVVGDGESDDLTTIAASKGNTFSRIVVGRLYQTDSWMLPAADTYRANELANVNDRRIAYVCDAIVKLSPTYVSGLVRLSWDTPISDGMRTVFQGVKACVRKRITNHPVKFDVVLNALHYAEPRSSDPKNGIGSPDEGRDRLQGMVRKVADKLQPDIVFFDFYTVPFNDDKVDYFTAPMKEGIDMLHRNKMLVGGNVWGNTVPDGTDFAALPLTGGFPGTSSQINALADELPTFVHIRNDPHICDSEGLDWFEWSRERRGDTIENHASKQKELGIGYGYPLFFPLSATGDCAPPNTPQVAYDAAADGQLNQIRRVMDRYEYRPHAAR
jgi:hypothetical protein